MQTDYVHTINSSTNEFNLYNLLTLVHILPTPTPREGFDI